MMGLIGFSFGYYVMELCDMLLMFGMDFLYWLFYLVYVKIV